MRVFCKGISGLVPCVTLVGPDVAEILHLDPSYGLSDIAQGSARACKLGIDSSANLTTSLARRSGGISPNCARHGVTKCSVQAIAQKRAELSPCRTECESAPIQKGPCSIRTRPPAQPKKTAESVVWPTATKEPRAGVPVIGAIGVDLDATKINSVTYSAASTCLHSIGGGRDASERQREHQESVPM